MIKEVCKFIENKTSLILGTTLFVNQYTQNAPDRCTIAMNTTGGDVNYYKPKYSKTVFSFITRSDSWNTANDDADTIRDLFKSNCDYDLPIVDAGLEYHVASSHPVGETVYIGEDEKNRHQFSVNIMFDIIEK